MTVASRPTVTVPWIAGSAAFLLFLLPGLLFYGRFIDEFYYVACSKRLAWGYVDHPPLAPFLLRVIRTALGDDMVTLRILPALAGACTVGLTASMARSFGAGRWGQAAAAVALLTAPLTQVMFGFFSMNALEIAIWTAVFATLIALERRQQPRLWLLVGMWIGLGFENKHTIVLLGAALAVSLVFTPARRHLATRWPWLAVLVTVALAAPNLLWQIDHGWPSLEFYRNADLHKNVPTPPLVVLWEQIQFMNPATLPLWLAGLVALLRKSDGADLRHVGWTCLLLLVAMMVMQKSRPDRIAGLYPVLLAAGGPWVDALLNRGRIFLRRSLAIAWVSTWFLVLGPLGLPVLPPKAMARYSAWLGLVPQIERGEGKTSPLPQWLADRLEWDILVDDVVRVTSRLSPNERSDAIVLALSYGDAGALELLATPGELPPVFSGHNTYWLWGPPAQSPKILVVLGRDREDLKPHFESLELAATHHCTYCPRWRDGMPIWIGEGLRTPITDLWPDLRHYE